MTEENIKKSVQEMMNEVYNGAIDDAILKANLFLNGMPGLYEPLTMQLESLKKKP